MGEIRYLGRKAKDLEKLLCVFIRICVNQERVNRHVLAEDLDVSERQVTRYINCINNTLFETGNYAQISYDYETKSYRLIR